MLWLIFLSSAALAEGGVTSASAEALAKAGVKNGGGAAGNNVNGAAVNGVNGQAIVAHLVPLGGSLFLPQAGNQVGQQLPIQQLLPLGAVQRGVGGPILLAQQAAQGAPVTFFALLPQGGAIGNNGQQLQLLPGIGLNQQPPQQQIQQPQQPVLGGGGGRLVRIVRSAASRLRRTQAPETKALASEEEEEEEEEEEGSGMDKQRKQPN